MRFSFGTLSLFLLVGGAVAAAPPPAKKDVIGPDTKPPVTAPDIPELTPENFRESIKRGYWFVKFYSPSCPHCTHAAPHWKAVADHYVTTPPSTEMPSAPKDNSAAGGPSFAEVYNFRFGNLNCLAFGDLCEELTITAWPTFAVYKDGKEFERYKGQTNDVTHLTEYTEELLEKIKPGTRPSKPPVIELPADASWSGADKNKAEKEKADEEAPVKDEEAAVKDEEEEEAATPKKPESKSGEEDDDEAPTKKAKDTTTSGKKSATQKPLPKKESNHNKLGASVNLDHEKFQREVLASADKWFIKFYAPWCGHCQAMAPAWAELGKEMQGQLNIGEVNCEVERRLCKEIGLRGYPTIFFFQNGEKVEYDGLRGLGDLVSYAQKAANSGIRDITADDYAEMEKNDELEVAFIYFYDQATTSEDFGALSRLTLNLVGHAPLLKTQDEELCKRFRVYNKPKLMVVRDGRPTYYTALSPQDLRDYNKVLAWMKKVWLPIVPELSAANSHEIMNNRMVVLGVLDRTRSDEFTLAKKELKEAAMEFMDQRQNEERVERKELRDKKQLRIEEAEDRNDERALRTAKNMKVNISERKDVVFAWVDGVFWERWVRSTYGINVKDDGERIIINDEDSKQYWDTNLDGGFITPSRSRILETLKAVLSKPSQIRSKSTSGRFESLYFFARNNITGHPWICIALLVTAILVVAVWGRGRMRRKAAGYFRLDGKEGLLSGVRGGEGKVD